MSLALTGYQRIATQFPTTGAIFDVLDAVYAGLGTTLYYDGVTTRTPGSGKAWTRGREQNTGVTEAVYGTPPTGALNHRMTLAGAAVSATKSPTMYTGSADTKGDSIILGAMFKNAGAYLAWDNANPWTSGQKTGFTRVVSCAAVTVSAVHILESEESIAIFFETSANTVYGYILDAGDPEATTNGVACESDGRVYRMFASGGAAISTTMCEGNSLFLSNNSAANSTRALQFAPGSATIKTLMLMFMHANAASASTLLAPDGTPHNPTIWMRNSSDDRSAGRLREICFCTDVKFRDVERVGATDKGYAVSGTPNATNSAILFLK